MACEEYLKVWLRFNSSPIEDAAGNGWTTSGSPTISTTNAVDFNALQLSGGSYIQSAQKIPIGGQDFTVDFWAYGNSSQVSYACFFAFGQNYNSETGGLFFARNGSNSNLLFRIYKSGTTTSIGSATLNVTYIGVRHHYAVVYFHSEKQIKIFVDGVLNTTISLSAEYSRLERVVYVGRTAWGSSQYFQGSIDEFRIFDGVALWADNFSPPTNYFPAPQIINFGTQRNIQFITHKFWTQPILTANGTIGDELAVSSGGGANSDAYKAFDSSATSYVNKMNSGAWLQFVTKATIQINSITITSQGSLPQAGIFQVSYDNGTTWTQCGTWADTLGTGTTANIVFDNGFVTGNYFRFLSQGKSLANPSNNADFRNVSITAFFISEAMSFYFGTQRKVRQPALEWRYENYGTATLLSGSGNTLTDLPVNKSKTGYAFYQTNRAKCFDIPTTNEIWVKFDVFTTLNTRWRAYNEGAADICGVCSQTSGHFDFWANGTRQKYFADTVKNQLQTVLLHMVSDSSEGIVEAWLDGEKLYTYTGNVNNGEPFADIYLQSDGSATFFSNVIISNAEIALDENIKTVVYTSRFDTARDIQISTTSTFDTRRNLTVPASVNFDTLRYIFFGVNEFFDTLRYIFFGVNEFFDTNRNLSHKLIMTPAEGGIIHSDFIDTPNIQSIQIDIAPQQITDQLSFTAITNADLMQQVKGQYLDYLFDLRVEKSRKRGILTTCRCCSNVDETLFTPFNYHINSDFVVSTINLKSKTIHFQPYAGSHPAWMPPETEEDVVTVKKAWASTHLRYIAKALGLNLLCLFDDFVSDLDCEQKNVTFADLINNLFNWSSKIPHILINYFIRNNTLYVIQRGYEQNTVDLSNSKITLPIIDKELVRTFWTANKPSERHYTLNKHYTGWKIAVPPPNSSADGKTHYNYKRIAPHGYLLTSSLTKNDDGSTVKVSYDYTLVPPFELTKETTINTDKFGHKEISVIKHQTLTPSQHRTAAFDEDGNETNSVIGSHVAGFYNEFKTLAEEYMDSEEISIPGTPLINPNFPVFNQRKIADLRNAIIWLNRKTQETISFDLFDFPHVIDFNDKIILNGVFYFLQSNTVIKNPRIVNQQSLTLARWY